MKVPLAEVIRPSGNRDDSGAVGESMHQLADAIETHMSDATVEIESTDQKLQKQHWQQVVTHLMKIRDTSDENLHLAFNRITELAK